MHQFAFFICLLPLLSLVACNNTETITDPGNPSDLSRVLAGSNNEKFKKAVKPREFKFPQDHGPHADYKTEWWYVTGNLETDKQRKFGFQFTLFRRGISPDQPESMSAWATNQIYMAHFAISDIENESFYSDERFSRASLKLAGAQAQPFKVWLLDWVLQSEKDMFFPLILKVHQDNMGVTLKLKPLKPRVLHGDNGLSKKGSKEGNASYYYSYTRLETTGELTLNNKKFSVKGLSWLDREWSTSALDKSQIGWDWFSLQLSSGDDIMFYQLRNKKGKIDKSSAGSYIDKNGRLTGLTYQQISIKPRSFWKSPTGVEYPSSWTLNIPEKNIKLQIKPLMNNQELNHSVRYWEGAVRITGKVNSNPVTGQGYVELSGY